ncbi:MAG: type III pantothenate kinase [Firmicutes bacterium]|nr:type III pantothenate kinase [Bacillota bacterium]
MILTIDIGNTNIVVGAITNGKTDFLSRIATDKIKTEDEYGSTLLNIFKLYGKKPENVTAAIISSVVPPVVGHIKQAVKMVTGVEAMIVEPGIKTGLNILMDNPAAVGSDLIVCAVAALDKYKPPIMVVDMGTATTISVIDKKGNYIGGQIMPGVIVSINALSDRTAQLPHISLDAPKRAIGKNTVDCMHSGVIYGAAAMIEGCIERMEEELGEKAKVVMTGGVGKYIAPHCKRDIDYDEELLLKGLYKIYLRNK